jgi:hypothetical protein
MRDISVAAVRLMPREQLEGLAVRAVLQVHGNREEIEAGKAFLAILIGFLLGAIVAASGFLIGLWLG